MADLPMERQDVMGQVQVPGTDFLKGALGMPIVRQVTLLVALAASVALGIYAMNWVQTDDFRPISTNLSPAQTNEIAAALDAGQMSYRIDPNSGMVLVPVDEFHAARMMLAGADVMSSSQTGYELLDEEQGFGPQAFGRRRTRPKHRDHYFCSVCARVTCHPKNDFFLTG